MVLYGNFNSIRKQAEESTIIQCWTLNSYKKLNIFNHMMFASRMEVLFALSMPSVLLCMKCLRFNGFQDMVLHMGQQPYPNLCHCIFSTEDSGRTKVIGLQRQLTAAYQTNINRNHKCHSGNSKQRLNNVRKCIARCYLRICWPYCTPKLFIQNDLFES